MSVTNEAPMDEPHRIIKGHPVYALEEITLPHSQLTITLLSNGLLGFGERCLSFLEFYGQSSLHGHAEPLESQGFAILDEIARQLFRRAQSPLLIPIQSSQSDHEVRYFAPAEPLARAHKVVTEDIPGAKAGASVDSEAYRSFVALFGSGQPTLFNLDDNGLARAVAQLVTRKKAQLADLDRFGLALLGSLSFFHSESLLGVDRCLELLSQTLIWQRFQRITALQQALSEERRRRRELERSRPC